MQTREVTLSQTPEKGKTADKPDKIKNAIQEFEGMLLAQMLQSLRESALGAWKDDKDPSGATALEMAEGQLARLMATQGGLGLARVLEKSMAGRADSADPKAAPGNNPVPLKDTIRRSPA